MTLSNKQKEMWEHFEEIKNKPLISINELENLEFKMNEAFSREEDRRKELIISRDS